MAEEAFISKILASSKDHQTFEPSQAYEADA